MARYLYSKSEDRSVSDVVTCSGHPVSIIVELMRKYDLGHLGHDESTMEHAVKKFRIAGTFTAWNFGSEAATGAWSHNTEVRWVCNVGKREICKMMRIMEQARSGFSVGTFVWLEPSCDRGVIGHHRSNTRRERMRSTECLLLQGTGSFGHWRMEMVRCSMGGGSGSGSGSCNGGCN